MPIYDNLTKPSSLDCLLSNDSVINEQCIWKSVAGSSHCLILNTRFELCAFRMLSTLPCGTAEGLRS
jgi:hypothetical protein